MEKRALRVCLRGQDGMKDELGEALMSRECLELRGYLASGVGISWEELAKILEHPYVQERLDYVWAWKGMG